MKTGDAYESAVSLLYESVVDPGLCMAAMASVACLVDAPRATRFRFGIRSPEVWDFSAVGYDQPILDAYVGYYAKVDPGWPVAVADGLGTWHGDEALMDLRVKSQHEFIHDFALPSRLGWMGGAKIFEGPASAIHFGVQREPGAPSFAEHGRDTFERLMPHLIRTERLRERLAQLADAGDIARATLDRLAVATFVVDAEATLHAANSAAETLFAQAIDIEIRHGKVALRSASAMHRFAEVLRRTMPPAGGGGALLVPCAGREGALQVLVVPLAPSAQLSRLSSRPLALVLVADPRTCQIDMSTCQALFSLTEAEATLACAIANATTLADWASSRGVALSTARSQLAALFLKTGMSSQAQLVRLLRTLPPVR